MKDVEIWERGLFDVGFCEVVFIFVDVKDGMVVDFCIVWKVEFGDERLFLLVCEFYLFVEREMIFFVDFRENFV